MKNGEFSGALDQLSQLKILVLGDLMLDVYDFCQSSSSRPSPERPGKLVYKASSSMKTLGGAGNVAANLVALDIPTVLISVCGADGHYLTLRDMADQAGIHHFLIREQNRPTTTKTRLYIDGEYILRRDDEINDPISSGTREAALREFRRELKGADAVILSDYAKGFFSEELAQNIIELARQQNVPVIVDFKPVNRNFFRGASLIAPNRVEAQALYPRFRVDEQLVDHIQSMYETLGADRLVVTLGENGICGMDASGFVRIEGLSVPNVDSVGCGDTVRAILALGIASGMKFKEVLRFANFAAAIVLQKIGTATLTTAELRQFFTSQHPSVLSKELQSDVHMLKCADATNPKTVITDNPHREDSTLVLPDVYPHSESS